MKWPLMAPLRSCELLQLAGHASLRSLPTAFPGPCTHQDPNNGLENFADVRVARMCSLTVPKQ